MARENSEKISACQAIELLSLRADVRKKSIQMEQLQKGQEIYRERIVVLDEKLKSIQDTVSAQQRFSHQNKRAVTIMSNTNRMLIGSLEALQGGKIELAVNSQSDSDAGTQPLPHISHMLPYYSYYSYSCIS